MEDNDCHSVRIPGSDPWFDLRQSSCTTGATGASLSQCPSVLESKTAQNNAFVVQAAMEEAYQQPDGHRLAVLPSRANSSVAVIEVKNLTTSNQQLILSRAMETKGQDNERLLTKIRERQDRYRHMPLNSTQRWRTRVMQAHANSTFPHQCAGSVNLVTCHSNDSECLQRFRQ